MPLPHETPLFPEQVGKPFRAIARICGYGIQPVTATHLAALHGFNSPFLEAEGTPITPEDVMIAAKVCSTTSDLERVQELSVATRTDFLLIRKHRKDAAFWLEQIAMMKKHLRPAFEQGLRVIVTEEAHGG